MRVLLLLLLCPTLALAQARPTCRLTENYKDALGCVPLGYFVQATKDCDIPAGACFTLGMTDVPVTRKVKRVVVFVYGQGATQSRAQQACRKILKEKIFGSECEVGTVEKSEEPFRTEMEVVEVESR